MDIWANQNMREIRSYSDWPYYISFINKKISLEDICNKERSSNKWYVIKCIDEDVNENSHWFICAWHKRINDQFLILKFFMQLFIE